MDEEIFKKYANPDRCPVRNVMDRIGDKWSMLVLFVLADAGVLRFNEMHRVIGNISQKMLTVTLKSLEADDLVSRKVYPQIPPKVEYALTERGKSLMPHLNGLLQWSQKNMEEIKISRLEAAQNN